VIGMLQEKDLKEGAYVILIKDALSKDGSNTGFKKGMVFRVIDPTLKKITQLKEASLFIKVKSCREVPDCTHISKDSFHILRMATLEEIFLAEI